MHVSDGKPYPLGPSLYVTHHTDSSTWLTLNLAVHTNVRRLSVCIFPPSPSASSTARDFLVRFNFSHFVDGVWHIAVHQVPEHAAYALYTRSAPHRLLADPYAKWLQSRPARMWNRLDGRDGPVSPSDTTSVRAFLKSFPTLRRLDIRHPFVLSLMSPPSSSATFDWQNDKPPSHPYHSLIIYEAHIKALTPSSTFTSALAAIPYLKWLGITAIQLMPIFEFLESEHSSGSPNMWGYSPISFFSPMNRYSSNGNACVDLKLLVRTLHQNNIECILDVVYNHSANAPFPLHFLKVQSSYYMSRTKTPIFSHSNISGCGNTLSPNSQRMTALIIESLRWFVTEYHIDGFRIDAAAVLCRDKNGVPLADPPILRRIIDDPVLRSTKFFLEGWDSGEHCGAPELPFSIGRFPYGRRFCEWNPQWRDVVRTFVKGECFSISDFIRAMIGSPHLFREGEMRKEKGEFGSCHGVNFVACHDGFCLRDVVSYSKRRNTDGYDEISFNCDVEGGTEESTVNEIRARQLRNFVFMLAVSRGIPMISQGDELGFSKLGNSNTWNDERYFACQLPDDAAQCQDMEALVLFTSYMFKLRTSLPHLTGVDFFDSVTWLDCAGREYDHEETGKDEANAVEDDGYVAFVTAFNKGEDVLFVAFNNGKSSRFVRGLPYEDCVEWTVVVDTFSAQWKVDSLLSANEEITIRPQSSLLCVGKERPCMEHC